MYEFKTVAPPSRRLSRGQLALGRWRPTPATTREPPLSAVEGTPALQVHSREFQDYRGAPSFALALGEHPTAVFTDDGPDNEQTEACPFHMAQGTIGDAVEPFEDALQFSRRDTYTAIMNTQRHVFCVGKIQSRRNLHPAPGILDRVVEYIGNRRPQLFGITQHIRSSTVGGLLIAQRFRFKMVAHPSNFHALTHQIAEINGPTPVLLLVAGFPGLEHLLDGAQQTIGIVEHEAIEFAALSFIHVTVLQGLQIKPDGGDGRLQFVGDGVDKAVMLLVAANFAHQKAGVHDESGNQQREEDYAQEEQDTFPPVENNPANIQ